MKINENYVREAVFAKYFERVLNGLIGSICRIAPKFKAENHFKNIKNKSKQRLAT